MRNFGYELFSLGGQLNYLCTLLFEVISRMNRNLAVTHGNNLYSTVAILKFRYVLYTTDTDYAKTKFEN